MTYQGLSQDPVAVADSLRSAGQACGPEQQALATRLRLTEELIREMHTAYITLTNQITVLQAERARP